MKTIALQKGLSVRSQTGNWLVANAFVPYPIYTISFNSAGQMTKIVYNLDGQLVDFNLYQSTFPCDFILSA